MRNWVFAAAGLLGVFAVQAETSDYVVDVPSGEVRELEAPVDTDLRVVKTGGGTLVLPAGNRFGGGVLVSQGRLRADYGAAGLLGTHVTLDGATYDAPAILQVVGGAFSVPLAAEGDGTIALSRYAGVVPYDRPLTIDFGGDGRQLVLGEDGFNPIDLILNDSTVHAARLVNPIDQKGRDNFTIKSGAAPLYMRQFTNSVNQGELNFWGGSLVFDDGGFFRTRRASWRDGTVAFTNATIRMYNDFSVGGSDANSGVARVTLRNCDKKTVWGTDHVNGNAGTMLTLDGGVYANVGGMRIGEIAGKTGVVVLTNDVRYTCTDGNGSGFYIGNGGRVVQADAVVALDSDNAPITIADGVYEMQGGSLSGSKSWMSDFQIGSVDDAAKSGVFFMTGGTVRFLSSVSFQIGSHGTGTFLMTGGEVSLGGYFSPGRYATGRGTLKVHGGHFIHRLASGGAFNVGEEGTGRVSVADGGELEVLDNDGVVLGSSWSSGATGTVCLSPGGVLKAKRIKGTDNDSVFTFNGGTFMVDGVSGGGINNTNSIITTYVDRAVVSSLGGVLDSGTNPVVRLARPLVAPEAAGDAREALAHRWKFDGGSLADSVGASPATVGGSVDWTADAVRLKGTTRGTSFIRLGEGLLPADGRGVTIEATVTLNRHTNWARIFDFGDADAPLAWTFNRGGTSSTFIAVKGVSVPSWTGTYRLVEGARYHFALVFAPQHDGTWKVNAYIHDPATGTLLDVARLTAPQTFSLAPFESMAGRLGCSAAETDDEPAADYADVRIYNRAMTEAQVRADAMTGPDKIYYFTKAGAGTLVMSGSNTYPVGTQVAQGTLELSDGATLPQTELRVDADATLALNATAQRVTRLEGAGTVKDGALMVEGPILPGGPGEVGTLTLDGTVLTVGEGARLVVDVAGAASDCLVASRGVDLSAIDLELANPEALVAGTRYQIVRTSAVTGRFRSAALPRKWILSYGRSGVSLTQDGCMVLIR